MDQMIGNTPPRTVGQMQKAGLLPNARQELDAKELRDAVARMQEYKSGKYHFDNRIVENNDWWRLRGGEAKKNGKRTSAWLLNALMGKHADAVEAYPRPNILPREEGDKAEAEILSAIIPLILERNHFAETYSDAQWDKIKSGTAVYGVYWDPDLLNGLGDISIRRINPLNLFWEPGITDIEESPEVFHCVDVDNDTLEAQYPQLVGKLRGKTVSPVSNRTDDYIDKTHKSTVVDWYRKVRHGQEVALRYTKFVGDVVLYDEEGIYQDGEYPFVFDRLLPAEGSPGGYGYIDIAKDTQDEIDLLDDAMVRNARIAASPRYFSSAAAGINEEEFADLNKEIIHVTGNITDMGIRKVEVPTIPGSAMSMLESKIAELKQVANNQDVTTGNASGVTAASAIAALQESAGRTSRDSTKASYRAYARVINKVIERIRQFYDLPRQFRIVGQYGMEKFITYTSAGIQAQPLMGMGGEELGYRLPVFDISVVPEKESSYSRIARNELAKELFGMGFFNPQTATQALAVLDFMDFDGKDKLMQQIQRNGDLYQQLIMYQQMALQFASQVDPAAADALAQGIMSQAGVQPASAPQTDGESENPAESKIVSDARQRSQQSTQPA